MRDLLRRIIRLEGDLLPLGGGTEPTLICVRGGLPDLHATILHQVGLDHTRLTYRHHGSEESLTDARVTNAEVVRELIRETASEVTAH